MEKKAYPRKSLLPNSREIRVISLSPGFWDDDISCITQVVSLDRAPAFSALSYAWGDPNLTESIYLDGESFPVMKNLKVALRYLRQQIEVRILWIDFLCIDQNDDDEKSWQVNMMGDIYRACENVFLWLGTESEDSDRWCESEEYETCGRDRPSPQGRSGYLLPPDTLPSPYSYRLHDRPENSPLPSPCNWHGRRPRMSEAFALVRMFAEDLHINAMPGFVNLTSYENTDRHRFVEPIQALNAIMRRSWWHRVWTVQEAVLPRNGIIMCGSLEIHWAIMAKAAINWHRHANNCCSIFKNRLYEVLNFPTHGEPTYMTLSGFSRHLSALNNIKPGNQETGEWNFMRTFQLFSNRYASDPRDKVFGLLGILDLDHRPILADYRIQTDDLNRRLSRKLLLSGEFSVLYDEARHIDHETIPSWVKIFDKTVNRVDQRIEDLRNSNRMDYNATSSKSATVCVCTKMTLSFRAIWVDKVDKTSRVFGASEREADMKAYFRECSSLIDFATRKDSTYQKRGTVREAFLRTAFGDRCRSAEMQSGVRRPKESEVQRLKEWIWELEDVPPHIRSHLGNNIKYNICNRVFFTTSRGLMGFGPSHMRAGDEVWVLFGAKVPIVLRPLQTTISGKEDSGLEKSQPGHTARRHRAVVGDCYVHGIMEGEALVDTGDEMTVVLR